MRFMPQGHCMTTDKGFDMTGMTALPTNWKESDGGCRAVPALALGP